jgi:ribosomal protein S18 acetylase RimI-like enzyme
MKIQFLKPNCILFSVSPQAQQGGIGTKLLVALEKNLINRGITQYKVIAGEKRESANKFYRKNGFVPAKEISIHGDEVSDVYVKEVGSQRSEVRNQRFTL